MTITFSRQFPGYHVRKGENTFFVEQLLNEFDIDYRASTYMNMLHNINSDKLLAGKLTMKDLVDFHLSLSPNVTDKKLTTIRSGHRWVAGKKACLRVWSKKPYNSPQIQFFYPTTVVNTYKFGISDYGLMSLNDQSTGYYGEICKNDGLTPADFRSWFKMKDYDTCTNPVFDGQIISFSDKINY